MTTSIRTRSGLAERVSKTASRTFPASPTVSMSSSASISIRRPARSTAWSSTIRTRTVTVPAPRRRSPCRRLRRDSTVSRPSSSPTRSRMPSIPSPSLAAIADRNRLPSSSITRHHLPIVAREEDAHMLRTRVLDDVRERFLHDPVERGRGIVRKLARRRGARRESTAIPVCVLHVSVSRSSAETSPKSSRAFGRSSTASRRTSLNVFAANSRRLAHRRARPPPGRFASRGYAARA